jgi:transcriptional regulator with XRE-family HTH domain
MATSAVRRRLVGAALRSHRAARGYTLDDAARVLECGPSKISRVETGQRGIRSAELRELLAKYGVGPSARDVLAVIADPGDAERSWPSLAGALPTPWLDYLVMETAASEVCVYDATQVPVLLQTPGYAKALAFAEPGTDAEGMRTLLLEAAAIRQRAAGDDTGLRVTVLIGESALRQTVGGPDIMAEQLRALARRARGSGCLKIHILPNGPIVSPPVLPLAFGSFGVLRFGFAPGLAVVHLPEGPGDGSHRDGLCVDSNPAVSHYGAAFDQLRSIALPAGASARLLRELAGGPTYGPLPRSSRPLRAAGESRPAWAATPTPAPAPGPPSAGQ